MAAGRLPGGAVVVVSDCAVGVYAFGFAVGGDGVGGVAAGGGVTLEDVGTLAGRRQGSFLGRCGGVKRYSSLGAAFIVTLAGDRLGKNHFGEIGAFDSGETGWAGTHL